MIKYAGVDSNTVVIQINKLASFHFEVAKKLPAGEEKRRQLRIAERYSREALRVCILNNCVTQAAKVKGESEPSEIMEEPNLLN